MLQDDNKSEVSTLESLPPDNLQSMEAETVMDLRLNKDFECDCLTEGYDTAIDNTELLFWKWTAAFKPGSVIVIEIMIGGSGV